MVDIFCAKGANFIIAIAATINKIIYYSLLIYGRRYMDRVRKIHNEIVCISIKVKRYLTH